MTNDPTTQFSDLLRRSREACGREATRAAFADAAGVSASAVEAYERGKRAPDQATCKRLARALRKLAPTIEHPTDADLWRACALRHMERREPAAAKYHHEEVTRLQHAIAEKHAEADARVAAVTSIAPAEEQLLRAIREAQHADPGGVDLIDGVIALVESMPRAPLTGPYGAPEPTDPAGQARRALSELSVIADPATRALLFGLITTAAKAAKGIAAGGYKAPEDHRTLLYSTRGAEGDPYIPDTDDTP